MSAVTGLSWSGDSLEGLGWGSRVWVLADGTWCPGTLASTGRDSATLEVFLEGAGKSRSFPARDVAPANPVDQESSDDLTTLPFVTEPGLLRCLQSRFDHDAVYTTAGPVLVAVNPFKPVPLYDVEAHRKAATPGTPHVYTVAQHAFSQVTVERTGAEWGWQRVALDAAHVNLRLHFPGQVWWLYLLPHSLSALWNVQIPFAHPSLRLLNNTFHYR